jgi:hypothetical protein
MPIGVLNVPSLDVHAKVHVLLVAECVLDDESSPIQHEDLLRGALIQDRRQARAAARNAPRGIAAWQKAKSKLAP